MNLDHDRDRERDQAHGDSTHATDKTVPGRRSASAALHGQPHAVASGLLMRKGAGDVKDGAEEAVARAGASGGEALPASLREKFESSLGADLSGVRVHTGAESQQAASSVGAKAYAIGNDVHFGAGNFDPHSAEGQHLIAHEVAHTVQQRGGAGVRQNKLAVSSAGDAFEQEADRAASAMVSGSRFSLGSAPTVIARNPEDKKKGDAEGGEKKEDKPEKPSITGKGITMPLGGGKLGSVALTWNEGSYTYKLGGAKAELLDLSHTEQTEIAPLVVADLAISGGVSMGASAAVSVTGTHAPKIGPYADPPEQIVMSASGTGKVEAEANAALTLGAGIGVPHFSVVGGGKAALEAKASMGVTIGGEVRASDESDIEGSLSMKVAGSVEISGTAAIVFETVVGQDRTNLYTYEIGSVPIARAGITCETVYGAAGVVDLPPVIEGPEWTLPVAQERQKRPLTPEERKKYFPVEEGASGSSAGGPNEVEMTEPELLAEALKQVDPMFRAHHNQMVPVVSGNEFGVTVDIDGHKVRGNAVIPEDKKLLLRESGKWVSKIKSGVLTHYSANQAGAAAGKKTVDQVVAKLISQTEVTIAAVDYETEQDPNGHVGPCKK